jgi:type 2A phosphatase activator TIP41
LISADDNIAVLKRAQWQSVSMTSVPNGAGSIQPGEESVTQSGFRISARKLPILKAGPIDEMTKNLGIAPPEMIFGDNLVKVEHLQSGWSINFNAFDALDRVDKTGSNMLQVAYSKEWQDNRQHVHSDIKEVIKPFDWSFTTDYRGSTPADSSALAFAPTDVALPMQLLMRQDPILFFASVDLFEDELADNGMSLLSVKLRVMPQRLLILSRFFLRLDDVIIRLRDTRVYIEFATGEVIREYTAREEKYDVVKSKLGGGPDFTSIMREPEKIAQLCPVVETIKERVVLPI